MRYNLKQQETIRAGLVHQRHDPALGIDPIAYSMDLFFIDEWLAQHFYPECDSLQLHWRERMDFAGVLLREYYSHDGKTEVFVNHWKCLGLFLDGMLFGELLDTLAGL